MYHTESRFKDIKIEELDELQARYLVDNYFKSERIYSYHDLEQFHQQLRDDKDYKLLFDQEAVDDPEILDEGCQISYKKVIRNHIFKLQLQSQKYSELFSADRYQNFLFERLFDEFSLDNEFIWKDKPTTFLMNTVKMFFEGIFLLLAAFYNQEFENEDIWSKGFELKERLGYEMSSVSYYLLLWLFLGSFTFVRPICLIEVISFWNGEIYFIMKMFSELLILLIAYLWIDYGNQYQNFIHLIGLLICYLSMGIIQYMKKQCKDEKEKLFYIGFMTFLIHNQKFTLREGQQIVHMLSLCAQRMSLIDFLRIFSQISLIRGILSPDQLRNLKFLQPYMELRDIIPEDKTIRNFLWQGGIPFIFQTNLKYENNVDSTGNEEQMEINDNQWDRVIIRNHYSEIRQGASQVNPNLNQVFQSKLFQSKQLQSKVMQSNISKGGFLISKIQGPSNINRDGNDQQDDQNFNPPQIEQSQQMNSNQIQQQFNSPDEE